MSTPDELRAEAKKHEDAEAESFERCDTDGFLSQWAHGITAQEKRRQAEIEENGGALFPALFDLDGNLVPAKLVSTRYGMAWGLLPNDDPRGSFVGWVNTSKACSGAKRAAAMRRKGYTVGTVKAAARAKVMGSGTGLSGAANAYVGVVRTDGGFSRDVEIISTEREEDDEL